MMLDCPRITFEISDDNGHDYLATKGLRDYGSSTWIDSADKQQICQVFESADCASGIPVYPPFNNFIIDGWQDVDWESSIC